MDSTKKSKAPLIVSLILLIAVVAGTAHDFRLRQAKHNQIIAAKPLPTPTVWPVRFVVTQGYQIALPSEFQVKEDEQTGFVAFMKIVKPGENQQSLIISKTKTDEKDPCKKAPNISHMSCLNIYDYRMLDWGAVPPEYLYTIIGGGYEYKLHFMGFPEDEKSKILASFRIT
jgi:hypothetical protein